MAMKKKNIGFWYKSGCSYIKWDGMHYVLCTYKRIAFHGGKVFFNDTKENLC